MINKFWKILCGILFFISSCQFKNEGAIILPPKNDSLLTEKSDTVLALADPLQDSLKLYFDFPVDFFELKKNTLHMHSGGSKYLEKDRLHQSQQTGTILYVYWAIEFIRENSWTDYSLQFVTWKPWTTPKEKYYETDNEELVGIESAVSWKGLGKSDFVGKTIGEIESKFGTGYELRNECLVYSHTDKILILSMKNEKVHWFKYYWLSESPNSLDDFPDYFFKWNNP